MSLLAREFSEMKAEADIYFNYLGKIDQDDARLLGGASPEAFGREFRTILKANALMLLYHMVEGTVQRAVDNIVDAVRRDNLDYTEASPPLRTLWRTARVRQIRRAHEDTWMEHIEEIIEKCIRKDVLVLHGREIVKSHAGNIDAQIIRNIASDFGFEIDARREAKGGEDLERIRHSRNLLAHGVQKFTEVGSGMTVEELCEMKDRVVCFLEDLIRCSDGFVSAKRFKRPEGLSLAKPETR